MLGIENRETILKNPYFLGSHLEEKRSTSWIQEVKPSTPSRLLSFPLHKPGPHVPEDKDSKHC